MNDLILKSKTNVVSEKIAYYRNSNQYTDEEIVEIERYLNNLILSRNILTYKVKETGKTNSSYVNDTTENLHYDIYTVFKANDELERIIDEYINASLFNINNVNIKLNKCIDKLNDFNEILKTKGNPKIITENFRNNSSFNNDVYLYKERYDEFVSIDKHLDYDCKSSRLTLPIQLKSNTAMYDNQVIASKIKVNKKTGDSFLNINSPTKVDSVIDTSFKNYWKETILSDRPINISFSDSNDYLSNYYYGIKHGAILELELEYESVCCINCIEIHGCTKYPMELVAIKYSDTEDVKSDLKELVFPNNENKELRSKVMDNSVIYNFTDITCKKIYFIFNQINYERKNFIINTSEAIKNDIWLNLDNDNKKIREFKRSDIIFKPNYLNRNIASSYLSDYNKLANNISDINFFELFYENTKVFKNVLKNCYEHGLYNISTFFVDYSHYGVYVSTPINVDRNIESISIITDEFHPKCSDGKIDTDIEYYVSYSDEPMYDNWLPILPSNINYINSELLQLGTDECILRFPAKKIGNVFMNDTVLTENVDYFLHYEGDYVRTIEIPNFNHKAIYKTNYEPIKSANKLEFLNVNNLPQTQSSTETVICDNTNIYMLKNVPYVDINNTTHVKIVNKETGFVAFEEGIDIYCCTDPTKTDMSYENFFDSEKLKYQYYTSGNKLIFNKNITNDYKVEITYKHHVHRFRLKAIMRRNNYKDTWLTPILNKIEYSVSVI